MLLFVAVLGGCAPLVGLENDSGSPSDVGADLDEPADRQPDLAGSAPDRPEPAPPDAAPPDGPSGPQICDPEDKRICRVSRPEEGVACPPTWTEARRLPCGPDRAHAWELGECATYMVAFWTSGWRHEWCNYDPTTRLLIGSRGHDVCGSYCGGVNTVTWGEDTLVCGVNTILSDCQPADGGAGPPPADGCGSPGQACCPGNRCAVGCCVADGSGTGGCVGVGERCGDLAGSCDPDGSCRACTASDDPSTPCRETYCGGQYEQCCPSTVQRFCSAPGTTCVHIGYGVSPYQCRLCGQPGRECCQPSASGPKTCFDGSTCPENGYCPSR
jgi:hypothetical protein